MLSRRQVVLCAPLAVASCGAPSVWAPAAFVEDRRYVHDGPPMVSLLTIRNVGSDNGAHSLMLINGDQRVMFDPAGSFTHKMVPERNDVHYGITPRALEVYLNFHTRRTYYTIQSDYEVSLAVANDVIRRAEGYGPVPRSLCSHSISTILQDSGAFPGMRTVLFPGKLQELFEDRPGIKKRIYTDDDSDDNSMVLQEVIF